jgi:hypothetical protein
MTSTRNEPADLLYGIKSIAEFLGVKPRAAEHMIASKRLPYFKIGKTVAARRTAILAALEELEAQAADS